MVLANIMKKHIQKLLKPAQNFIATFKNSMPAKTKRFKEWFNKKHTPAASNPARERWENMFFYALGNFGIIACTVLAFCWGEDVEGSRQALQEAKIIPTAFNGYPKGSPYCKMAREPYQTLFNGIAVNGEKVSGVVCKSHLGNKRVVIISSAR